MSTHVLTVHTHTGKVSDLSGAEEDLGQRDPETQGFLEFDDEDERRLRNIGELTEQYAEAVIDAFYDHLLSFKEMKAFFPTAELLARVKGLQKSYFLRLTQGNYDAAYVEDRLKIGAVYERINLPVKFYLGIYNFYLREVGKRIFEAFGDNREEALATFFSLMKLTFLDMELAINTYRLLIGFKEPTTG